MKFPKKWFVIVTIMLAVVSLSLSRVLWPAAPEVPMPTQGEMPFFILLGIIESLAFGFGIAFLFFGWKQAQAIPEQFRGRARLGIVCLTWLIASWWPHGNWHIHIGFDTHKLLYIEYGFHVTLIIAATVLAVLFFRNSRELFSATQK